MIIPPPDANLVAALAWLAGTAGGLSALAVIVRWVLRAGRVLEALAVIVEREMTANGGSSMKDKLDEQCAAGRKRDALLQFQIESDAAAQEATFAELAATRAEMAAMRDQVGDIWYRVTGLR